MSQLERFSRLKIHAVYPGHGPPVTTRATEMICSTLENVQKSMLIMKQDRE
jgi:hypothetical protein